MVGEGGTEGWEVGRGQLTFCTHTGPLGFMSNYEYSCRNLPACSNTSDRDPAAPRVEHWGTQERNAIHVTQCRDNN